MNSLTMSDRAEDSMAGYHQFAGNEEGQAFGSFEVWYDCPGDEESEPRREAGWYWWACFPDCMPDGEAEGPYHTSTEAYDAAQDI